MTFFFAALLIFSALPGIAGIVLAGSFMLRDGHRAHGCVSLYAAFLALVGTFHLAHILTTV